MYVKITMQSSRVHTAVDMHAMNECNIPIIIIIIIIIALTVIIVM